MVEIQAPNKIPNELADVKSVFLAGSIEMGLAENWQEMLVNGLSDKEVILLNPRRDDWDSSWVQSIDNFQFSEQVNWEMDMLNNCDIIIMYFDPNTKAPISLLELGLHAGDKDKKIIVCCDEPFWKKGNVDIVCKRYEIEMVSKSDLLNKLKELI